MRRGELFVQMAKDAIDRNPTRVRDLFGRNYPLIVALAVAAISIALSYASTPAPPAVRDALGYVRTAQRIVTDNVYSYTVEITGAPNAVQTPGYPLTLAAVFALTPRGDSPTDWASTAEPWITALQMLMAVGIVALTARAGRRIGGARFSLVAASLAAVYLPYYWAARVQLSDLLGALLMSAAVAVSLDLVSGRRDAPVGPWRFVVFGLLAGGVAMVRPAYSLWPLAPFIYLALARTLTARQFARRAAVFAAAAALVMAPWWIRNVVTLDELVLLNTNSGVTMLDGLGGRDLTPYEEVLAKAAEAEGADGSAAVAWHRVRTGLRESTWDFLRWRTTWTWLSVSVPGNQVMDVRYDLRDDPDRPDGMIVRYGPFPNDAGDLFAGLARVTRVYHMIVVGLAIAGVLFVRVSPRLAIPLSLPLYAVCVHYVTMFNPRYFMPAMNGMFLLAAAALVGGYLWIRRTASTPPDPNVSDAASHPSS